MTTPRIILDTNVLVAALRSRRGAAFKLLSLFSSGRYRLAVSVPLLLEYEDVLSRRPESLWLSSQSVADLLDQICAVADKYLIYFLWRPHLPDPKDDHLLELAVASRSPYIVTYNRRDFTGLEKFGIVALTPKEMLTTLGELP